MDRHTSKRTGLASVPIKFFFVGVGHEPTLVSMRFGSHIIGSHWLCDSNLGQCHCLAVRPAPISKEKEIILIPLFSHRLFHGWWCFLLFKSCICYFSVLLLLFIDIKHVVSVFVILSLNPYNVCKALFRSIPTFKALIRPGEEKNNNTIRTI